MTEKLKLPTEVVDSGWKDDIDDYALYKNEADYVSPEKVESATAEQAKMRNIKIGRVALFSKNEKLAA